MSFIIECTHVVLGSNGSNLTKTAKTKMIQITWATVITSKANIAASVSTDAAQ